MLVQPHSAPVRPCRRAAHLVEALGPPSGRVHQVRLAQTEHGGVRQRLVQVGVEVSVGLLDLVLGVDDGERGAAVAGAHDEVGAHPHETRAVEVVGVLEARGQAVLPQGLAQGDGDEVLEQLVHVEQEAVHGERFGPGSGGPVLRRGAAQDGLGEPQRGLVAGGEARRLPTRQLLPPHQRQGVGETDTLMGQAPPDGTGPTTAGPTSPRSTAAIATVQVVPSAVTT